MPLYGFHCASCDREVELLLSFAERGSARCPSCGGKLNATLTAPADHRGAVPACPPGGATCCGQPRTGDMPACGGGHGHGGCCHG